jgi:hypothetical protein
MRLVTAQDLAVEHSGQHDVVSKPGLTRTLRARIDFAEWFADYLEIHVLVV